MSDGLILFDTGSQLCLASQKAAQRMRAAGVKFIPASVYMEGSTGGRAALVKEKTADAVRVSLTDASGVTVELEVQFLIVSGAPFDVLLGTNALKAMSATVDYSGVPAVTTRNGARFMLEDLPQSGSFASVVAASGFLVDEPPQGLPPEEKQPAKMAEKTAHKPKKPVQERRSGRWGAKALCVMIAMSAALGAASGVFSGAATTVTPNADAQSEKEVTFDVNPALPTEVRQAWFKMLEEERSAFATKPKDLATFEAFEFTITDKADANSKKLFQKQYGLSAKEEEVIMRQCHEMHKAGLIEPAPTNCQCASPGRLVLKYGEDGEQLPVEEWRFLGDFRRRNEATTTDHYRMPTNAEIFQRVKRDGVSKIDLYRGYHQFRVAEADRPKTAFWGGKALWQYVKMPMGLEDARACFQRGMDMTWAIFNEACRAYIDDVLCFAAAQNAASGSSSQGDQGRVDELEVHYRHIEDVQKILRALKDELACGRCSNISNEGNNKMLLCDHCGCGWHQLCLEQPLLRLPARSALWFCPWCVKLQRTWRLDAPLTVAASIQCGADVRATLEELMPGPWSEAHMTRLASAIVRARTAPVRVPTLVEEIVPLLDFVNWSGLKTVLDPWSGNGTTRGALAAHPTTQHLEVRLSDIDQTVPADFYGDALDPGFLEFLDNETQPDVIVTSPHFAFLDVALATLAATFAAALVCVHVPGWYISNMRCIF